MHEECVAPTALLSRLLPKLLLLACVLQEAQERVASAESACSSAKASAASLVSEHEAMRKQVCFRWGLWLFEVFHG